MRITDAAQLLGFTGTASFLEIRQHYHELLKEWHPDVSMHSPEESHEMVIRLKQAYDLLVDYCMNYQVSFQNGDNISSTIPPSMQYWHDHFGDDPIWG